MELNKNLSILTWKDVAEDVRKVNSALANEIDALDPDDSYKIIRARYRYGQFVLKDGVLCLPTNDGKSLEVDKYCEINPSLKAVPLNAENEFGMPMGLTLSNSLEMFLKFHKRDIPFTVMPPGKIFALSKVLDKSESFQEGAIWSITAGARSIFLLPKISEVSSFWQLKKEFGLTEEMPQSLGDHWKTFVEIAEKDQKDPWYVDLIFFSRKWLENKDGQWKAFHLFLFNTAWTNVLFLRSKNIFEFLFSSALEKRNMRSDPYVSDTAKHLFATGAEFYPGFVVADDDTFAPIKFIQKAFTQIYELQYAPTIMHLDYLNRTEKACYYSLQYPTLMEFSPKSRIVNTNIKMLEEINALMNYFLIYILEERPDLHHGPIYSWTKNMRYQYFHNYNKPSPQMAAQSNSTANNMIVSSHNLPKYDKHLKKSLARFKPSKLEFCSSNIFMRGAVRITQQKPQD